MNFTPAQQMAIDSRGALLVSAAAGSGKTAVLVERVVQCVLDRENPVDIDRMLVVTFTKAAAGEMRQRIRNRLAEEYQKDPSNTRLLRQQMLLQKANICTIDSFCKNLITEHFEVVDLSPDFTIISENTLKVLKKAARDETLELFFQTDTEGFTRLAEVLGADQDVKNLTDAMEQIYKHMQSMPFPEHWIAKVREDYQTFTCVENSVWGQMLFERAGRMVERGIASLTGVIDRVAADPVVEAKRGDLLRDALAQLQAVQEGLNQQNWDVVRDACQQLRPISFQTAQLRGKGFDVALKDLTVSCQGMMATVIKSLNKIFALTAEECGEECRLLTPHVSLLLDAVWEYRRRIDQKKMEQNALDFSDLEAIALRLLVEWQDGKVVATPLCEKLCEHYTYVMVDEFQDVNNLQSEIFHAISSNGRRLFAVGDVKQSIYRFRKANPGNFLRLMRTYPPYQPGEKSGRLVLDGNFRSRHGICQTVNAFFGLTMSEYMGDLDYDDEHCLRALGTFPDDPTPSVELSFYRSDQERSDIQMEADLIAAKIREAMTTPCVTEQGNLRTAKPGDCVILLRSLKNRAPQYVERLRQHGFSVMAEQDEPFFERQEVMWVLSLLQVLDNPTDDVAMLATLLSPWFGFTTDEMAQLRNRQRGVPLTVCLDRAADDGDVKAAKARRDMNRFRIKAATGSVDDLLGCIYDTYGVLSAVRVMENGNQCRNNLLALRELVKECVDNGYDRVDGFLRYVKKLQEEKTTVVVSSVVKDENAIRIMSIHHSKGLQFPICFVAGCGNGLNKLDSTAPILLDEQMGLGLTLTDDKWQMRRSTCMRQAVAAEVSRAGMSEELRVLYVAMTRGIDRLILLTALSNPEKAIAEAAVALDNSMLSDGRLDSELVLSASGYGQWLLWFALLHPSGGELQLLANSSQGYITTDSASCAIRLWHSGQIAPPPKRIWELMRETEGDPHILARLQSQLDYVHPYAPLQHMFAKRSVSQLVHHTPYIASYAKRAPRPSFLQEGGLSAAERGTALHTFMQYADYERAALDAADELARLVEHGFMTHQQADGVDLNKVTAFFAGSLYARMAVCDEVMREHRFMSQIPVTRLDPTLPRRFSEETVVVQGITDCVFMEQGKAVVVDYKTDRIKQPEELVERYGEQLRLYGHMLSQDLGLEVKELLLYSFCLDQTITVPMK